MNFLALQIWMGRTVTGLWGVHFPMCLLFPCLRIGSTGLIGTHTQWKRHTSTLAKCGQSWEIIHTGPMTSTSITYIDSRAVSAFWMLAFFFCINLTTVGFFVIFCLRWKPLYIPSFDLQPLVSDWPWRAGSFLRVSWSLYRPCCWL